MRFLLAFIALGALITFSSAALSRIGLNPDLGRANAGLDGPSPTQSTHVTDQVRHANGESDAPFGSQRKHATGNVLKDMRWPGRLPSWRHANRRMDGALTAKFAEDCLVEEWFDQTLDHTSFRTERKTFQQRYLICKKWWKAGGPVFFYAGNEDNVELYVNATGLIWENAADFDALVVFAEHRYYGQTQPFGPDSWKVDPSYLTTEQVLMDYASLAFNLTRGLPDAIDSPIILFGGSYGGMLSSWLRMKYPHIFAGAIAGSAPIAQFPGERHRPFQPSDYWKVVTQDATPAAGATKQCVSNVRDGFKVMFSLGSNAEGRAMVQYMLHLCDPLDNHEDLVKAALWLQGAWDAYAMGNYPYASSYISGDPDHPLPAWPMKEACLRISQSDHPSNSELIVGLREAAAMLYNVTQDVQCFDLKATGPAAGNSGPWDYQWCSQLDGQEVPYYPSNGITDMFWDQGPFLPDSGAIQKHCEDSWDITPRPHHSYIQYGGLEGAQTMSNIVFSNGLMDPWSAFGVVGNAPPSVSVVIIPEGAHHIDLMFSHPGDTDSIKAARVQELDHIRTWIHQYKGVGHT